MSQGNSSHSSYNTLGVTNRLSIPIGQNLTNTSTRTLAPSIGALAYDSTTNNVYFGGALDIWVSGLGTTGNTGIGATGHTGMTGLGMTGRDGSAANTGSTGNMGLQGNTGNTGIQGNTGSTGKDGLASNTGSTGSIGNTGSGHTGSTGKDGLASNTGSTGQMGQTGASLVMGAYNTSSTPNGAVISGGVLNLYSASGSNSGGVNTTSQQFGGIKHFLNGVDPNAAASIAGSQTVINWFFSIGQSDALFTGADSIFINYSFVVIGNQSLANDSWPILFVTFPAALTANASGNGFLSSPALTIPAEYQTNGNVDAPFMTSNGGVNVIGVCRISGDRIILAPGYLPNDPTTLAQYTIGSVISLPRQTCVFSQGVPV
jgi:hypothetical protein